MRHRNWERRIFRRLRRRAVGTTAPQKTGAIVRFYQPLTINYQPILTLTCLRARVVSVWFEIREWKFCLVLPADPEPFRPADFACGHHSLCCLPGGGSGFFLVLQSGFMRRQLSRLGLDKGLVAILTASISLVSFLVFLVLGLNLGGLAIAWDAKVPAIGLSLVQILQLIALVAIVFWFASAAKRFLFNRFLSKSGLDRSLQYTIAQICGYLVLTIGIVVALQSAGLESFGAGSLCRRGRRRHRVRIAKHCP